jgi:hypothetical protein
MRLSNIRQLRKTGRVTPEEFLLNLDPDFVDPPFGPIQLVLKVADLRLNSLIRCSAALSCADTFSGA